jgi:uncharacterized GH25 family protein
MKRPRLWAIGLAAVGCLLFGLIRACGRTSGEPAPSAARNAASHGNPAGAVRRAARTDLPSWVAQPRIAPRRVAGRVTAEGKPVAGATVRIGIRWLETFTHPIAAVTTKPDGTFDFGARAATTYVVSAEHPDHLATSLILALSNPTTKGDQVVLELGRCRSRLFGSVIDSTNNPIPGARVRVAGLGGVDSDVRSGSYSLCIPVGSSLVTVEAEGYGAINVPVRLFGELRYDFELVPESIVAGQVVDESARPVADAVVIATPVSAEGPHVAYRSVMAGPDGRFSITNLAPGMVELMAIADGFATETPRIAVASPTAIASELRLVVKQRAQISGRVLMKGSPIAGARVSVKATGSVPSSASYSQSDGSFVLDGVPRGNVTVAVTPYEVQTPRTLAVNQAKIDDVTIEVSRLATLRGRVVRHGRPVAGAEVRCSIATPRNVRTDAEGGFLFEGLPAGVCDLFAQELEHTKAFSPYRTVPITAGQIHTVDLDLAAGAEVRGTVVDEAGKPVPGVYVLLVITDHTRDQCEAMTDARGEFACIGLTGGGEYNVGVFPSPAGGEPFAPAVGERHTPIAVKNGDDVVTGVRIAVKLERLTIRGRVVDDAGAPVADARVAAIGRVRTTDMQPLAKTDGSGAFEVRSLAPGTYTLHAHAGDGGDAELKGIAAGATDVEIRLVRTGSIEGQLAGFDTPPTVVARVTSATQFRDNRAIVDGSRFTFSGMVPATYIVEATSGDEGDGVAVEVRPGETARVTLKSRGRGDIEGRLVEFGTKTPLAGVKCEATLSVNGAGGTMELSAQPSITDAQGMFRLKAPVGRARAACYPGPAPFSVAGGDVEVSPNGTARIEVAAVRFVSPPSNLGFELVPMTLPVTVAAIRPDGAAAKSTLAVGDQITMVDGAPVAGLLPSGVMALARNHRAGSTLVLGVQRAGQSQSVKIAVGP